ncbi:MAG: aldo/keto reductase [Gammaproteobacteria bacterium]|nr:aldo/keto reductase [Gammaproteobacteria bacterium]MDH4312019.1 aldo/keto reductase [Gammaproteobacteria bacterium]MDH5273245.1 aldo/keto reductase [Gammaproteobacteria bacterium]
MRSSLVALGATDLRVSRLAWGMWRFKGDDTAHARTLVDAAFDAGMNLFDTADIYGFNGRDGFGDAEVLLGRLFAADPGLRGRMVLASKGGIVPGVPYDSSADCLVAACEASLRRLGTDHLDLFQVHRPDVLTHPAEVARALEALVASGKVRAVGVSNYTPTQTAALVAHLQIPLASIQPEFSPLVLEPLADGTLDLAMQHRISVLAWSPLAGGRLGAPGDDDGRAQRVCAELDAQAQRCGVSRTAATYAWIMAHPAGIVPIVGSQQASRIREAADACKVSWTRAAWYRVLVASRGVALP